MHFRGRLWFCWMLILGFMCSQALAQEEVLLTLKPTLGGDICLLGKTVVLDSGDSLRVDVLKFYLGDYAVGGTNQSAKNPSERYQLIDISKDSTRSIVMPLLGDDQLLRLRFGVDSITNDLGIHEGDLDPSNDMYWAWQSGYINFKLEGWSSAEAFAKTNGELTYHLGGFLGANLNSYPIEISANELLPKESATLVFAVDAFVQDAAKLGLSRLMRPGEDAVTLANSFSSNLRLEP